MSEHLLIETERPGLVVRRWRPEDKPALLKGAGNRKVWRNLTHAFPHPYTEADADFWLVHANQACASLHLAIVADGMAIGGVGIQAGEGVFCQTGELGYWLAEDWWGRGIASAAARAVVDHADRSGAFARLEAGVFAWNPASMRVLEKIGFEREAVLRRSVFKDGCLIDRMLYVRLTPRR